MGCRSFGVETVLVGLVRIGLTGLGDALAEVERAGLEEREAVVDRLIASLSEHNYLPEELSGPLRIALWREHLRRRGEDVRPFLSTVDVTVRGAPGATRDGFVADLEAALARLELRPLVAYAEPDPEGPDPQLVIGGEVVVRGRASRKQLEAALRKSVSDW